MPSNNETLMSVALTAATLKQKQGQLQQESSQSQQNYCSIFMITTIPGSLTIPITIPSTSNATLRVARARQCRIEHWESERFQVKWPINHARTKPSKNLLNALQCPTRTEEPCCSILRVDHEILTPARLALERHLEEACVASNAGFL